MKFKCYLHRLLFSLVALFQGCTSLFLPSLAESNRIREVGAAAEAEILKMSQTGYYLNQSPEVRFELKVYKPDGTTYIAVTDEYVSLVQLGELRRGARIAVKIDPNEDSKVAIAHED